MPAAPAAAAPPPAADIPDLDGLDLVVPAAPANAAVEDQDEEWDRLAIAASGASDGASVQPVPVDRVEMNHDDDGAADAEAEADDGSSTKIELARAYLDIGDIEGAKGMLEEVLAEAGPAGRAEAARLLKDIG